MLLLVIMGIPCGALVHFLRILDPDFVALAVTVAAGVLIFASTGSWISEDCPRCGQRFFGRYGSWKFNPFTHRCRSCGLAITSDTVDWKCGRCGYDLRGLPLNSNTCSECGNDVSETAVLMRQTNART
jgi:phage FluMu protein Com